MREQRVQAVDTLVNSRFDWAGASTNSGACCRPNVSLTSLDGTVGSASGYATSTSSSAAAGSSVASATPPGSVPTFTLAGCTTSQAEVALTIDRLRLMTVSAK